MDWRPQGPVRILSCYKKDRDTKSSLPWLERRARKDGELLSQYNCTNKGYSSLTSSSLGYVCADGPSKKQQGDVKEGGGRLVS